MFFFKSIYSRKIIFAVFISLFSSLHSQTKKEKYVDFTPKEISLDKSNNIIIKLHAKIKNGFKMYAHRLPEIGPGLPSPISFKINSLSNNSISSLKIARVQESFPKIEYDPSLNIKTKVFYKNATFKLLINQKKHNINKKKFILGINYTLCAKRYCLPPTNQNISISF